MIKRKYYLDVLRILSIFAVIVIHICNKGFTYTFNGFEWNVSNVYNSIFRFCIPVFVMISGALMLNNDKEITLKKLYLKNALHLVIAFVIWTIIYGLIKSIGTGFSISSFIQNFGCVHLWFIPMIVGLYVITPLLRKITADEKATKYFVIVSLVFTFLIPAVLSIPQLNAVKDYYDNSVFFHFTLGYVSYYVLGYYLDQQFKMKKELPISIIVFIVGALLMIFGTRYLSIKNGELSTFLCDNFFSIPTFLMSIGIFIFFKNIIKDEFKNEKVAKGLVFVSNNCFGIYIIHVLVFKYIFEPIGFSFASFNPIFSTLIVAISTFVVSLLITVVLKWIPGLKKFIL